MDKKYYFISGLPRSGSTLLTSILNQNPNFYSNLSDSLVNCVEAVINNVSNKHLPVKLEEENIRQMLLGMVDGYYYDVPKSVIFNCNRSWTKQVEYLHRIDRNFKVICMVRNFNSILNSFEKLYKSRRLLDPVNTPLYDGNTLSVWHRTEYLGNEGFVRVAYANLQEAYFGQYRDHLLLVEYEDLVTSPKETLNKIYDFIDQPKFEHDFNSVEYLNADYDDKLNTPGLHDVRKKVEKLDEKIVLPPDLWNKYSNWEFWRLGAING